MAITHVGTFASNAVTTTGTTNALSYTTVNLGDVVMVTSATSSATVGISTLSGGGVTTWNKIVLLSGNDLWWGKVTTVGAVTLTATYSASIAASSLSAEQYTNGSGSGTTWSVVTSASHSGASSTTMTYDSMTATAAGQLWFGYAVPSTAGSAGSTSGFTYQVDNATFASVIAYSVLGASGTVTPPTAPDSPAGTYVTVGAIMAASSVTTVTATATLAGSGALNASPAVAVTTTLAGAGSLTANPATAATVTLTGAGTLVATPALTATASLTGSGSLSATPTAGPNTLLAGAGTLTATAVDTTQNATVTLTGNGSLTGGLPYPGGGIYPGGGLYPGGSGITQTSFPTALLAGTGSITAATAGSIYMPYVPEGWTDNSLATPLSAARMSYMETGMVAIDTAQQGKAPLFVPTLVKTSAYTAAGNDLVPVDLSAGSVAITLPSAPADKTQIAVQVVATGSSNSCSVLTGGTDVFDKTGGSTSKTLSLLGEYAVLEYKATGAIWYLISSGAPRASLDSRYVQTVTAADSTVTVGGTATAPTVAVNAIPESKVTNLVSDLAAKVTGVTAANTTITIAGTATAPTVALGTVPESAITNLTSDLAAKAPLASPTFTGTLTVGGRLVNPASTLTYASTVTTDVSTDDYFRITLTGALTLANPTNPSDGQKVTWELIQDATGSRLLTLGSAFDLGGFTVTLTTTANKRDFLTALYNSTTSTWYVTAFAKGY